MIPHWIWRLLSHAGHHIHPASGKTGLPSSYQDDQDRSIPLRGGGGPLPQRRLTSAHCPVQVLLDYLGRRGNCLGPLFLTSCLLLLHRHSFDTQVQQALHMVGIDGSMFYGYSFQDGAETATSAVGIPETNIHHLGRWWSSAYQSTSGRIQNLSQDNLYNS